MPNIYIVNVNFSHVVCLKEKKSISLLCEFEIKTLAKDQRIRAN